ncbi:MAG: uncharacterized protein FD146_1043 [Anaerolineaceae bacterium]|nr:MAG: uncharacterized protein FD146_1043 [Anaerolineaceae bacterium]
MKKNLVNIEIKTTNICNLECVYCYQPEFQEREWLTESVVDKIIEYVRDLGMSGQRRFHFLWHGGEPTLHKVEFYKYIVKRQKEILGNTEYINFIQTNGVNLHLDLLEFMKSENFIVGISIDGPELLHDKYRKDRGGRGTYDRVVNTIKDLKMRNIPVLANCVLRKSSLEDLEELYNFFKSLDLFVTFNILLPPTGNILAPTASTMEHEYLNSEDYGKAIVYFLDRWLNDKEYMAAIDTYNYIIWSLIRNTQFGCFKAECPQYHRAFSPSGKMYVCGRFYGWPDNNLRIGYLSWDDNKSQISESYPDLLCSNCPIVELCHGGCAFDRYAMSGSFLKKEPYCVSYLIIYEYFEKHKIEIESKMRLLQDNNPHFNKIYYE